MADNQKDLRQPGQDGFESPVFDLRPGAGSKTQIGEETIQIAPHPTTNRFPWAAVNNPTVPIYGAVPEPIVEPPVESAPLQLPEPDPESEPKPVELPPETPPPEVVPAPEPEPEPMPELPPPPPTPRPAVPPRPHGHNIFSVHTREVWRVMRPGKAIRIMTLALLLIVAAAGVAAWMLSGASIDTSNLPLMDRLLRQ